MYLFGKCSFQFEADRRAFIITINSFGTELSKDDREKLYPTCGKLYPDGLKALARADDYEQVRSVAEYYWVLLSFKAHSPFMYPFSALWDVLQVLRLVDQATISTSKDEPQFGNERHVTTWAKVAEGMYEVYITFFYFQDYKMCFDGAGTNPGEKTLEDKFFEYEANFFITICINTVHTSKKILRRIN